MARRHPTAGDPSRVVVQGGRSLVSAEAALDVIALARSSPPKPETIGLLLDADLVGRTCVVVDATSDPDDVLDVARLLAEVAEREPKLQAAVIASIRTHAPPGLLPARHRCDVDRWLDLLEVFDEVGVELLDWFVVVGDGAESLRTLTGMPQLWPGR
jgi:hypothetical protein